MGSITMRFVTLALLSSGVVRSCSPRLRSDLRFRDETRLFKRWFSVGKWEVEAEGLRTTWPEKSTGMHEIRYCFMENDDYEKLNDILQAAIEVWEPAFEVSSLNIVPSSSDVPPICKPGDEHSLILMSRTQQETLGLERSSSLGYSIQDRENQVMFNLAMPGQGWSTAESQRQYDVHSMGKMRSVDTSSTDITLAHELGHAMGLAHEQVYVI
ncbi:hypothetical protein DOTSEDRAFT_71838 [Dothistroma septosporum NZE10]|uniref:Peptidase metallopeptidase domain-containing protein n=1 Tax=Dothistroma septosporum (strain NZE10 / CBS 128990) TaxID=675120 RepID=N1PLF1_DOTSN|nr:hypothetical protein DOTSEDRAFT_71838 [Dothistroma septosporum NZE10]